MLLPTFDASRVPNAQRVFVYRNRVFATMEKKTKQLREIFMEVAGDPTITESQVADRGTLTSSTDVDDKLRAVIVLMLDSYDFRTSIPLDDLIVVVKQFFAGATDEEIVPELETSVSPQTVSRARINLHLITDDDKQPSFDYEAFREDVLSGLSVEELTDEFGISASTVKWYKMIVEIERERRLVGDRYRDEFARLLDDRDLSDQLTKEIRESGLRDATEDIETNVSF